MRHRYRKKKLGRDSDHRRALFKNLIKSLIIHEEIRTTESKAKAVRRIFEKLVTKSKEGTVQARRLIHAFLQDKKAVNKLTDKLAPIFKERKGGFTRIIRLGKRKGDRALMVKLELVAKTEEAYSKKEKPKSKKEEGSKTEPAKKRFSLLQRRKTKGKVKKP